MLLVGAAVLIAVALDYGHVTIYIALGVAMIAIGGLFALVPHVSAAVVVAWLVIEPAVNVVLLPGVGPTRHVLVVGIVLCVILRAVVTGQPLRRVDSGLLLCAGLLAALYVASPQRAHDAAWVQGARYVIEPIALLIAGAAFPSASRSWKWAATALMAAAAIAAAVGVAQQFIGAETLVQQWGYQYGSEIRTSGGGTLRSLGTLDEPFSYAVILLAALAVLVPLRTSHSRARIALIAITTLLIAGVVVSYVRTAFVILALLALLAIFQRRHTFRVGRAATIITAAAVLAITSALAVTGALAGGSAPTPTKTTALNGRLTLWERAIGTPYLAIVGHGVGAIGAGATRAQISGIATPPANASATAVNAQPSPAVPVQFVDSLYVSTIIDVGVVGLLLLVAVLARSAQLGARSAKRGAPAGWIACALVLILAIDGLTRSSLSSVPSGMLLMFLIGLAIAAGDETAQELASP